MISSGLRAAVGSDIRKMAPKFVGTIGTITVSHTWIYGRCVLVTHHTWRDGGKKVPGGRHFHVLAALGDPFFLFMNILSPCLHDAGKATHPILDDAPHVLKTGVAPHLCNHLFDLLT
jgi:hypothetical protein